MRYTKKSAGKSLALVLVLLIYVAGGFANAENMVDLARTGQLDVHGQAIRTVMPDTVDITIGATARHEKGKEALNEVNLIIEKVIDALVGMNVPESQIKTSRLNISPRYGTYSASRKIEGYTASVSLTVTLKNFDLINTVIDTSVSHGANNIGGMRFSFSDEELVYQQALEDAIIGARGKAERMAKAAGVEIETLLLLRENSYYTYAYVNAYEDTDALMEPEGYTATQIMAGEIQISASVDLTYETR